MITKGKGGPVMNMTVNEDALNWYKEELDLQNGDQVRFFVRYMAAATFKKVFL